MILVNSFISEVYRKKMRVNSAMKKATTKSGGMQLVS